VAESGLFELVSLLALPLLLPLHEAVTNEAIINNIGRNVFIIIFNCV
jgi:hypothetical protein